MTGPADGRAPGRHLALVGPDRLGQVGGGHWRWPGAAGSRAGPSRWRSSAATRCRCTGAWTSARRQPTAAERAEVPHHLVDVVDPSQEFSVSGSVTLVDDALDDIERRGADAILVGGTGLYVRAVIDGLALPPRYPEVAARLEAEPDTAVLVARLQELDPVARVPDTAGQPPPHHPGAGGHHRLRPAVLRRRPRPGRLPAHAVRAGRPPPGPRRRWPHASEARYGAQMDAGFLDEVRALAAVPGGPSRTAAEALGYRELLAHLRGGCTLDDAVATAACPHPALRGAPGALVPARPPHPLVRPWPTTTWRDTPRRVAAAGRPVGETRWQRAWDRATTVDGGGAPSHRPV